MSTELREMITENLDELSPLLRTAFVLRDAQDYSTSEAAKKLGVTENTLKARVCGTHGISSQNGWAGVCAASDKARR